MFKRIKFVGICNFCVICVLLTLRRRFKVYWGSYSEKMNSKAEKRLLRQYAIEMGNK